MGVDPPFKVMKMSWNQIEVMAVQHGEYTECHRVVHVQVWSSKV